MQNERLLRILRQELECVVGKAAAWCRFAHPDAPPYTLAAVASVYSSAEIVLFPAVIEAAPFSAQARIRAEAEVALFVLGYRKPAVQEKRRPTTLVFARELSAHEELAAIRFFLAAGLQRPA